MFHIRTLRSVEELRSISGQWDHLLERSLNDNLFLTWDWLSHWINTFLTDHRPLCLVVYEDDNLVGLAPLWLERRRYFGLGTLNVLRFIGSQEVCSDHLDLIVSRKNSEAVCSAIWEHLYGPLRKDWDVFEYRYVPSDSHTLNLLYKLSENDNRCLGAVIQGYTVCPYVTLPETWDAYLTSLSANQRRALKVSSDLMAQAGALDLRICDTAESLHVYMQTHIDLHRKSWIDRGQSGSFGTDRFRQFHRQLAGDLLAKGKLFLCNLELNGTPVGSFYGFEHNKVMYYYLLGVERSAAPRASIGRVLLGRCIKAAIERGCREFDMLRGDEEYKYHWTSRERRELSVTFYNRSAGALVQILRQFVNRYGKQVGKTVLGNKTPTIERWLGRGKRNG